MLGFYGERFQHIFHYLLQYAKDVSGQSVRKDLVNPKVKRVEMDYSLHGML